MVEVTQRTANWRLLGGGGLMLGGLLIVLNAVVALLGSATVGLWLGVIGYLVVGIALFFVAFGQTGSNGAVGASIAGKIALVIAGAAGAVLGILGILALVNVHLNPTINKILLIIFVVALLASAVVIFGRGVAKGIAKWALFVPVVAGILVVIDVFINIDGTSGWTTIVFGAVTLLTGLAYLFNKLDV